MKNNKPHRDSGPASFEYHENGNIAKTECYVNGRLHNEKGPAVVEYDQQGRITYVGFFINGVMKREEKHSGMKPEKAITSLKQSP